MPKKVLFTASTYSHVRHFHLPYLQAFQEDGWTVHVACAEAPEEIPFAEKGICLPFKKQMFSPANFRAAWQLRKTIKKEKYTLITTHTSLAAFFTRLAVMGLKNRPRVVNMTHGYLFDDNTHKLKKALLLAAERMTAPVTDLLLTMNNWDYETAQKYRLGKQIAYVPGIGVDFERFKKADVENCLTLRREFGIPDDAFVLIYAAEFSARKSQSVLIQALKELPEKVYLLLPGQGALLEQCREQVRALGVESRVLFPGYVHDMPLWYGMANAAVTASRSEGLPFNIMEAMYAGLPVVASAVKGHTDLVRDGETGLLYPYGNGGACAGQVLCLMQSETLRDTLVQTAKEDIKQYDLQVVLPVVMAQYESVLPGKGNLQTKSDAVSLGSE